VPYSHLQCQVNSNRVAIGRGAWRGAMGRGAWGELSRAVVSKGGRETGGWAKFDWMLDGSSLKAQPIGSFLACLEENQ
jgi:hypothetical protein